jgi:hypothetical protein
VFIVIAAGPWEFGWSALVAVGTLALALGTSFLAFQAKREATKVGEQVELERERLDAITLPYVVPAPSFAWANRQREGRYTGGEAIAPSLPGLSLPRSGLVSRRLHRVESGSRSALVHAVTSTPELRH